MTAGNPLSLRAATAFGHRRRSLSLVRSKAGLSLADCTSHESVDFSLYSGGMMLLSPQPAVARQTHATATMAQVHRCRRRRGRERNNPVNRQSISHSPFPRLSPPAREPIAVHAAKKPAA